MCNIFVFSSVGELFGVKYLYNQTGKVLDDYKMAIYKMEDALEVETDGDDGFEDEGFTEELGTDFLTVPTLENVQHTIMQETPARKRLPLPLQPNFDEAQTSGVLPQQASLQFSSTVKVPHSEPSSAETCLTQSVPVQPSVSIYTSSEETSVYILRTILHIQLLNNYFQYIHNKVYVLK